jgi:hypothetical protein
MPLQVLQR